MPFSSYSTDLVYDVAARRGVGGAVVQVTDLETGVPVTTYDENGVPRAVITNPLGFYPTFWTDDTVQQVMLKARNVFLPKTSEDFIKSGIDAATTAAQAAVDAANLVGAPADTAIATAVNGETTETRTALNGLYAGKTLATASADGLMAQLDKAKLDAATASATANTVALRDANGRMQAAAPALAADIAHKGYVDGVAATQQSRNGIYNVKDYGAVGDGTTDDTAAIQAALDAAKPVGGTIRAQGNFKLTSRLNIGANCTFDATGSTISLYTTGTTGDWIMMTNGIPGETPTGYTGKGNITFIGGIWDARGHLNTVPFASTFAIAHAYRVTFQDVTMRNVCRGHSVDLAACRNVRFNRCNFEGYTDNGDPRGAEAIQVDISTSTTFPTFGGWDSTPCDDVIVDNCRFQASTGCGVWPRAVGSHSARTDRPHTKVKVINSTMDTSELAVRAYNWVDFKVAGNHCNGGGVYVLAINSAVPGDDNKNAAGTQTNASAPIVKGSVQGNTIVGVVNYPIWLSGDVSNGTISDVEVSGNIISGQTGTFDAISLSRADDCTVENNSVRDGKANGIRIGSANRANIARNNIQSCVGHGIMLDSSGDCLLDANIIRYVGGHGVSVSSSGANHVIRSNYVIGAGTAANLTGVGIRLNSVSTCSVVGNSVRKGTNPNQPTYGLQIVSGASGTFYTGNDLRDSGASGSILDTGSGSITTPAAA